jgi:hypothetical protein
MISVSNKFRMMSVLVALAMLFSFANVSTQVAAQGAVAYDANAARWTAMGQHYTQLQAQRELELSAAAHDAYAARWTAMGEHYTQLQAQRELELSAAAYDAYAARWTAMGRSYLNLCTEHADC